LDIWI